MTQMMNGLQTFYKLSVLVLFLYMVSCIERDRSNIFDPGSGIDSLETDLYLSSADSVITLHWSYPEAVEVLGVNIYRKIAGESLFQKLISLPAGKNEFKDHIEDYDLKYQYYLTFQGMKSESPPTKKLSVTAGPHSFWIIDRWDYYILRLSYDLQHVLGQKFAVWVPESMSFDRNHDVALVTFPQLQYAEIFNINSGEVIGEITKLTEPFDCAFDTENEKFWITDRSGAIYTKGSLSGSETLVSVSVQQPSQIRIRSGSRVFILDEDMKAILILNTNGSLQKIIGRSDPFKLNEPFFIESSADGRIIYILDKKNDESILYRYDVESDIFIQQYRAEGLHTVRIDPLQPAAWVSINSEQSAKIVQLSSDGQRLKSVEGFKYISDFMICPSNGNLIIADADVRLIKHVRPDGSVIGSYAKSYYPYKVYSE